ncbi:hypothetical protein H4R18_003899 [Coemansia javaensis]|uniref:Uncharacterized protein n=1 Tax=Coemansia javaensis TaxID=2761396 RepID=A0A9W8H7R2_9FUNG|nr:hypothetical protein H4R18_003899 [Coemansia javaensis]
MDVPEAWVYSEGQWMLYLGPEQRSYTAEQQLELFGMSIGQLIAVVQSDFGLDDGVDLALEFPSLALVMDQRDRECEQVSLLELFSCHVAAVALGRLPLDYAASPYFSAGSCPSPASFSLVVHTRPKVQSTLQRIMQVAAEHAQAADMPAPALQPEPAALADDADDKDEGPDGQGRDGETDAQDHQDKEEENDDDDDEYVASDVEASVGSTAALLEDANADDDEDDDDYVVDGTGEEEGDHVLGDDVVDEDEGDDDDDDVVEVVAGGSAEQGRAKRTKSQQQLDDGPADETAASDAGDDDVDAPAAKRARSDDGNSEVEQAAPAAA